MNIDKVYLSLGSNMGNSYYYLLSAINELDKLENTSVTKVSKFYKTAPWGNENQNPFINCAVEVETKYLAHDFLGEINKIEKNLGRERKVHWGPRTVDIDIIFYKKEEYNDQKLIVPHRYYKERDFVLIPLGDIIDDLDLVKPYIKGTEGVEEYVYPKKILMSSCIYGDDIRYDGENNYNKLFVDIIKNNYLTICPEDRGGLGTPRNPAEIINKKVITNKGEDVTEEFLEGARLTKELAEKEEIEIAIMKAKSPSCGYGYIYDGSHTRRLVEGNGLTVEELLKIGVKIISI